ncbi:MAG: acylneuraminate cytidylyltransferase family protein [Deltaproteobacteria bacterium]|nr:acylneuraminate cytidylyltransferase family protein [Deltaproteobacteria bacterium]
MKILAIIPARGGSKGIPRKNLCSVAGKPLIVRAIENAHKTKTITRVVVSTDDEEIGSVAREQAAEVIPRPVEISGDGASSEAALLHALDLLKEREGYEPNILVFLQCTAPLTLPDDIDGTVKALLDQAADSALAVAPFHAFLWEKADDGNAVGVNHQKEKRALRQQLRPQFIEAGSVYVMRTEGFREARHRFFGKVALHVIPRDRCLEIDDPADLMVADALLRLRAQEERAGDSSLSAGGV